MEMLTTKQRQAEDREVAWTMFSILGFLFGLIAILTGLWWPFVLLLVIFTLYAVLVAIPQILKNEWDKFIARHDWD